MTWLQIMKTGRHTATSGATIDFTDDVLRQVAEGYDPSVHEAPIVVGHPADNAPAYGWVRSLRFGTPVLEAEPHQVDAAFAELVGAGRFKKISASLYTPTSPNNPTPGKWYLRHVGFLGAAPPAVKGLRDAQFSAGDEGVLTLTFQENTSMDEDAKRQAELEKREKELAEREAKIAERARKQEEAEAASFVEARIKEGRVLPVHKAGLAQLLTSLSAEEKTVDFSEAGSTTKVTPRSFLEKFLQELPVAVEFGELGGGQVEGSVDFSVPQGYSVDSAGLEVHRNALAYQAKHPEVTYIAAVKAVSK